MNNKFLKIFNICFFIIFSFIVIISIFNNNFLLNNSNYKWYVLLPIILIILLVLIIIKKIINKLSNKTINYLIILISIIILLLQIFSSINFKVISNWDFSIVYKEAISFQKYITFSSGYFSNYPNNIPLLILLENVFLIFKFFNITNYLEIGNYFNMMMIDLSILFTCLLVNKIYDKKKVLFTLILYLLLSPIYLYVPIFYTDTITMIFPVLLLYIYNRFISLEDNKKKKILLILFIIIAYIGIELKFTVIIMVIALIIFSLIKYKFNIVKNSINILIVVSTICLLIITKNIFYIKYINSDIDNNDKIPYTHWVAMGLTDNGGYNASDAVYAEYMKDFDKERNEEINIIKERIKEYIDNKTIYSFINRKLTYTWGDGTYYAPVKLLREPINKGVYHEILKSKELYYICTSYHLLLLIMMIMSCFNRKNDINMIGKISLIGLVLFLLIWETRSRYLVNYIPIIILVSLEGFDVVMIKLRNICCRKN